MHKDARLVKSAFATLDFPLSYHTDRDSEFGNMAIDELLNVFDYKTHALQEGPPRQRDRRDNQQDPKGRIHLLREVLDAAQAAGKAERASAWRSNLRPHSTLGYMSPVEFRLAGLTL